MGRVRFPGGKPSLGAITNEWAFLAPILGEQTPKRSDFFGASKIRRGAICFAQPKRAAA